jgi:hypothetical protein
MVFIEVQAFFFAAANNTLSFQWALVFFDNRGSIFVTVPFEVNYHPISRFV